MRYVATKHAENSEVDRQIVEYILHEQVRVVFLPITNYIMYYIDENTSIFNNLVMHCHNKRNWHVLCH